MSRSLFVCEAFVSENFLVLEAVYRSESGRLGFEVDDFGGEIFQFLLKNSATWDFRKNEVRVFDENIYSDPFSFLSGVRPLDRFTRLLTFRNSDGLDENLIKNISNIDIEDEDFFLESAKNAVEKGYFLTRTNFNNFSISLFTRSEGAFIDKIRDKAASFGLMVNIVAKEGMPDW